LHPLIQYKFALSLVDVGSPTHLLTLRYIHLERETKYLWVVW